MVQAYTELIAPGEAILFNDPDSAVELLWKLKAAGFKDCVGNWLELERAASEYGIRWWPNDPFPDCISYIPKDGLEMLLSVGCLSGTFADRGYRYRIRYCDDRSINVDDLL